VLRLVGGDSLCLNQQHALGQAVLLDAAPGSWSAHAGRRRLTNGNEISNTWLQAGRGHRVATACFSAVIPGATGPQNRDIPCNEKYFEARVGAADDYAATSGCTHGRQGPWSNDGAAGRNGHEIDCASAILSGECSTTAGSAPRSRTACVAGCCHSRMGNNREVAAGTSAYSRLNGASLAKLLRRTETAGSVRI
jgi:hypothetical protein